MKFSPPLPSAHRDANSSNTTSSTSNDVEFMEIPLIQLPQGMRPDSYS